MMISLMCFPKLNQNHQFWLTNKFRVDLELNLDEMWEQLTTNAKPNCVFIFSTTTKYGFQLIQSTPKQFSYELIWEKSKPTGYLVSANRLPLRSHEMIYVFKNPKHRCIYNPQKAEGEPYKRTEKPEQNINSVYGAKTPRCHQ